MTGQFLKDGYAIFPDVVLGDALVCIRAEADHVRDSLLRQMNAARINDPRITWWQLTTGRPYLLKIKPVLGLAPAAGELAAGSWMRENIGGLLGAVPVLMEDKFMYKQELDEDAAWARLPILGEEVRKHTDAAYFGERGFDRVITVAVCLDDCTAAAGALKVWPGTHARHLAMVATPRQGPVIPDELAPDSDAVLLAARAGSVLAWESNLVHASDPNVSGNPRRLLVLGYAPGGAS